MSDRQTPIRVLHLEDNPRDAALIADKLTSDGMNFDIKRADSAQNFAAALAEGSYDIILCDCNIPGYDGFAALSLAQKQQPGTPVIIVSGSMGEEEVVNCLHLGAKDYLLKQRLDRFVPAVKRALQDSKDQQRRATAEAALRESEERFRQLAEQSSEGFWFVSVEPYRVTYASPAASRIWGISLDRLYEDARTWRAAIHPADQERVNDAWESCLQGRSPRFEAEYRLVRPDGEVRWVLDQGTPMRNERAEIVQMGGVATDITERKQAEGQMLRTQRLESIGTLAGGIAHDLNNALLPILMSTELLRLQCPDETEVIDTVALSARRAADMVRQLLTFAKGIEGARLLV